MLVNKFDLKVWVVVISEKPFSLWIFSDYYIRFKHNQVIPGRLDSQFQQLMVNSLISRNRDRNTDEGKQEVWTKGQYLDYLKNILKVPDEKLKTQAKQIERIAKICVHSNVAKLKLMRNTAIVLEFSLIVDELLNVWLLGVKSSPSTDPSIVS